MSKSSGFFLITGITELAFALFALTKPRGYDSYGFVTNIFFDFQLFLIIMAFLSIVSTVLLLLGKTYRITTIISSFLAAQWLMIVVAPFFTNFYTIALPLLMYFFIIRILITVAVEEGVRNGSSLWS